MLLYHMDNSLLLDYLKKKYNKIFHRAWANKQILLISSQIDPSIFSSKSECLKTA